MISHLSAIALAMIGIASSSDCSIRRCEPGDGIRNEVDDVLASDPLGLCIAHDREVAVARRDNARELAQAARGGKVRINKGVNTATCGLNLLSEGLAVADQRRVVANCIVIAAVVRKSVRPMGSKGGQALKLEFTYREALELQ